MGPLSWSNWNLERLVFVEGGEPENPEKNPLSKARTNSKLNVHIAPGQNRTCAALMRGERSQHFTIPAPYKDKLNTTDACESVPSISSDALASVRAYSVHTGRFLVTASKVGVILWTWK